MTGFFRLPAVRKVVLFIGIVIVLWIFLYFVENSLPFVKPGAEVIYNTKWASLQKGELFKGNSENRIAFFGDSKTLSGFNPVLFDDLLGLGTYSFNMGMPSSKSFVNEIELLAKNNQIPRIVLLQFPWEREPSISLTDAIKDDKAIIQQAFPFRQLPRNLAVFMYASTKSGGPFSFYETSRRIARQLLNDRGYYFIEGQSHFPGHRLPSTYSLPTDKPEYVKQRLPVSTGQSFNLLKNIAQKYNIDIILVPEYFRQGALATPPSANDAIRNSLRHYPQFRVVGPDYILFENGEFSDPVHLNKQGAEKYTRYLVSQLVTPISRILSN